MKKRLNILVLLLLFAYSNKSFAYIGPYDQPKKNGSVLKGANCAPANAKLIMEFNNVRALIEQGGSLFQNRAAVIASYEIPKGEGTHVIFAGALWMGGKDVNGQLKLAALRYRSGNDFWPGPLTVTPGSGNYNPLNPVGDDARRDFGEASIDPDQCIAYDKFFTIRKAEVIRFSVWWECNNGVSPEKCDPSDVTEPTADELKRIYAWPAQGDISKGQDYFLAPYYDRNQDGVYRPAEDGDYPWYDDILDRDDIVCGIDRRISLFGDETHWWVFNDKGNIHTETSGEPIGMEIRAQAFSFASSDEINDMTFYNYELINRGTQTLFDTYFSQYLDADVGNYLDDYAGCDVSRGLGYMFNGDPIDESDGGKEGYGKNPPAIGCDFFEGPYQDADGLDNVGPYFDENAKVEVVPTVLQALSGKGIVYKGIGIGYSDGVVDNERFGMRRFTYYTIGTGPYADPVTAANYYNYMSGLWANGSEMFYGGAGHEGSTGVTTVPSDYMFPGDSDPLFWATAGVDMSADFPKGWDESTNNNDAGDRRFVQSAGPFTLRPGAVNNITVGMVYARGYDGDLFSSVRSMKRADTKAQALFDACFRILSPPDAPKLTIQELNNELILMLENPSSSNNYQESYAEVDEINITDPTLDRVYRFEGYQIYQFKNEGISVSDIGDESKARLVAQCDIKNDVSRIINFEFDEQLGFSIPVEKVNGENKGIRHSFQVKKDAFTEAGLVNYKTYYYVAIAYAFNQYKKYDPNNAASLDGQKMPYISSRLNFDGTAITAYSAMPHNPSSAAGGTVKKSEYGTTPRITRLDGHGNGNRDLEFTSETLESVLNNGFVANPEYDYGKGPLGIKVVDPLNVANGYFECKFKDYKWTKWDSVPHAVDTASWVIYRYDKKDGQLLDSVESERTIAENNEQIIPQWGISVNIVQNRYKNYQGDASSQRTRVTDLISASIDYEDSSKQWLSFVPDDDQFRPTNWIRSGTYDPEGDENYPDNCLPDGFSYENPCNYPDEVGYDNDKVFAKLLGGGVAPHRLVGYQADFMPLAYYQLSGGLSGRNQASISFLPSVNIVLTSDKSKWTRCPVIELGREANLNVGGAKPGGMRKSPSVDKNGNPDGSGTGMGWFPGYAVDMESGARLYMAFGENSFLALQNGADMIWNPTSQYVSQVVTPVLGGMHAIYVFGFKQSTINKYSLVYDFPAYNRAEAEDLNNLDKNHAYKKLTEVEKNSTASNREFYSSLAWVAYPMLAQGQKLNSTDVTIRLRVNKEYKDFVATGENNGQPLYGWSMDEIATTVGSRDALVDALSSINVVPNPYYAYSEYEGTAGVLPQFDNRVKITNLPERCNVRIYTVNGKLIRTFKKDSPLTYLDWDLKNWKEVPVGGGVYLIHVDVPNVGEVVLKFFASMRQIDLQGY